MTTATATPRPHRAARTEDAVRRVIVRFLRSRGWAPRVEPYPGYGTGGRVRVLGRVLLAPPGTEPGAPRSGRGWRRFFSAAVPGTPVEIEVAGRRVSVTTERGGYLDVLVDAEPPPGRATATLRVGDAVARAPLYVVPRRPGLGVVSDIDDTVMVTALPRPLLAFWNTFVRHEASRRPVPGMARLYQEILRRSPDAFVVYVSTGPWNVAPALTAFLARHGFPPGPMLLTDWGPTPQGWFRSGSEHKRTQLRRLLAELPQLSWLLVGDDGQHDPLLYREAARAAPGRVRALAIRQLSASEQVLTHGTPAPPAEPPRTVTSPDQAGAAVPEVRAPDGSALLTALTRAGILPPGG